MSGPDISATRKKWECISEVGNKVINGPEQEIPAHKNAGLQSVTSFLFSEKHPFELSRVLET